MRENEKILGGLLPFACLGSICFGLIGFVKAPCAEESCSNAFLGIGAAGGFLAPFILFCMLYMICRSCNSSDSVTPQVTLHTNVYGSFENNVKTYNLQDKDQKQSQVPYSAV